jgi:hypothetical protein
LVVFIRVREKQHVDLRHSPRVIDKNNGFSPALETAWVDHRPSADHTKRTGMVAEKHMDLRHSPLDIWPQNDFSPVFLSTAVSATSAAKRKPRTCLGDCHRRTYDANKIDLGVSDLGMTEACRNLRQNTLRIGNDRK